MNLKKYFLFSILILTSAAAWADEDESILPLEQTLVEMKSQPTLDPKEAFVRTQAVLAHYGVPTENDPAPFFSDLQSVQSLVGIQKIIGFLDPTHTFDRYTMSSNSALLVFQDMDSRKIADMSASLKAEAQSLPLEIGNHALRTPEQPLKGLRIALDPGHMGGHKWDLRTGKYVQDEKGNVVSEGVTALQVSLLLKAEFEKLGASVLVTHERLAPVSDLDADHFDLKPYALNEIRESVSSAWFQNLLSAGPVGPKLFQAFDESTQIKTLFGERSRDNYFVLRADLAARSEMIEAFKADIALVIHFDAVVGKPDPTLPNATKTFVVGSYSQSEFASRTDRKYFLRHLLDQRSWDLSMNLSRNIVKQFHDQMGLQLGHGGGYNSTEVEPGILSRNLGVTRRLKVPAVSYLECLFYGRPQDFNAFLKTTHPMMIDGQNVPYSDHVVEVMKSIRDGVIAFAKAN